MSTFPPPPGPLYPSSGPRSAGGFVPPRSQAPMSGVSIAAFVFSLLACLPVINAIVGIILGIIGLVQTKDGARRGRGFAIAAIPISLVTGAGGAIFVAAGALFGGLALQIGNLAIELEGAAGDPAAVSRVIYDRCSADFTAVVSRERFEAWWVERVAPYGPFVDIEPADKPPIKDDGGLVFVLDGKFQNATVPIAITIKAPAGVSGWFGLELQIEDIQFDGVSPRGLSQ